MKCPNCGAQAREGSRFCMACGVELKSARVIDPSEAETVVAPTLSPTPEKKRAASLGPAGDLPGMSTEGQGIELSARLEPAAAAPPAADLPPPPEPAAPPPPAPPEPAVQPAGVDPGAITVEPAVPTPEPVPQAVVEPEAVRPLPPPPPPPAEEPSPVADEPSPVADEPSPAAAEPQPDVGPAPDVDSATPDPAAGYQAGEATGLTDQWMAIGEEQASSYDLTAAVGADDAAGDAGTGAAGEGEGDMEFDDGEEVEVKKSKTGKIIGGVVGGCCLLMCCGGLIAGGVLYLPALLAGGAVAGAYDYGVALDDVVWGQLRVTADSTKVLEAPATDAAVIETRNKGEVLDYYGYSDATDYYRVKAPNGSDAYVQITDVELNMDI